MNSVHEWKVISDFKSRRIIFGCTCGWQQQKRLLGGADSTYADANAWAMHFNEGLARIQSR